MPLTRNLIALSLIPRLVAVFALIVPVTAQAQSTAGSGPIESALMWMQNTMLGNVATAVAVMAIAAVGFGMLTGRMNWRFGATVIIGIFIIFGAPVIVAGIQSTS